MKPSTLWIDETLTDGYKLRYSSLKLGACGLIMYVFPHGAKVYYIADHVMQQEQACGGHFDDFEEHMLKNKLEAEKWGKQFLQGLMTEVNAFFGDKA